MKTVSVKNQVLVQSCSTNYSMFPPLQFMLKSKFSNQYPSLLSIRSVMAQQCTTQQLANLRKASYLEFSMVLHVWDSLCQSPPGSSFLSSTFLRCARVPLFHLWTISAALTWPISTIGAQVLGPNGGWNTSIKPSASPMMNYLLA